MQFLKRLFARPPRVIDAAEFGPAMTAEEVAAAIQRARHDAAYIAFGQLLLSQREVCAQAVMKKSNLSDDQVKYEAGAMASAEDVLNNLRALANGGKLDSDLRQWFKPSQIEQKRAEQGRSGSA